MKKIFSLALSLTFAIFSTVKVNAGYGNPLIGHPDIVQGFINNEKDAGSLNYYSESPVLYKKPASDNPLEFEEYRDVFVMNIPYLLQDNCGFMRAYTDAIEGALQSLPTIKKIKNKLGKEAENNADKLLNEAFNEYSIRFNTKFDALTDFFHKPGDDREKTKISVIKAIYIQLTRLAYNIPLKGATGVFIASGALYFLLNKVIPHVAALALIYEGVKGVIQSVLNLKEKLDMERAINYSNMLNQFTSILINNKQMFMNHNIVVMAVDARRFTSLNLLNAYRENHCSYVGSLLLKGSNFMVSPPAGKCNTNGGINKLIKKIEDTLNGRTVSLEKIKQEIDKQEEHELLPKKTICSIQ